MDWKELQAGMGLADDDYAPRTPRLLALNRVLDGVQYDHIGHCFSEEKTQGGEYIPISRRRPSARSNLCRVVVDDVVSLLFGDGHFPTVMAADETTRTALTAWFVERNVPETMMTAATKGSVGSVALRLRIFGNKPYVDALTTAYFTPTWRDDAPDELAKVTEKWKAPAKHFKDLGYKNIRDDAGDYWFMRVWDAQAETWFIPWPVLEEKQTGRPHIPVVDTAKTVTHGLGFVPLIWVKNLPGGDAVDGVSTFERAISTVTELDYLSSQGGRGLKYASDPTLVLKTADTENTVNVGGAATALYVPIEGDAKLLEINGSAASAVINACQDLRTTALEQMHGNRAHPDKMTAAQSGRAMELLNQGLVWLAGKMRTSYGDGALRSLLKMVCDASVALKDGLTIDGEKALKLDHKGLELKWPSWYPAAADERLAEMQALAQGITAGVISRETAVLTAMEIYSVTDLEAELAQITTDMAEADARTAAQQKAEADAQPKPAAKPAG